MNQGDDMTPKLSEGAERLRDVICDVPTWISSDLRNQKKFDYRKSEEIAQAIVTELGITPEMVEDVRPLLQPSDRKPHAMNQAVASDALATLLEVAGK